MTVNALHEAIIERLEEELNRMACFADKRIRGYSHDIPILDYQEDEEDAVFPYFKVRTTDVDIKEEDSRTETYILVGIRESDRSMAGYFVLFSVLISVLAVVIFCMLLIAAFVITFFLAVSSSSVSCCLFVKNH